MVGNWAIFSSYGADDPSKLVFVLQHQDSCVVPEDDSGISSRLDRAIWVLLEVRRETLGPFLVATVILGFVSVFNKSQASSPFEAFKFVCLLRYQRDVRPPVQMKWETRAFSRVSKGDSYIP